MSTSTDPTSVRPPQPAVRADVGPVVTAPSAPSASADAASPVARASHATATAATPAPTGSDALTVGGRTGSGVVGPVPWREHPRSGGRRHLARPLAAAAVG